jgi:peptidylprolyl isomerase
MKRSLFAIVACFAITFGVAGCAEDSGMELTPIPAPSDVAGPPSDATRTGTGLSYKVLVEGSGATPTLSDRVNVHYTGWTTDGEMFDSSVARGVSATFAVDAVIEGWTEGLQLMQEGGSYRLWIPEALAYRGVAGRPSGMLVFDVELISVLSGG